MKTSLAALLVLSKKAMRGFALVIVVLLIGELHFARTAPSAPEALAPPSPEEPHVHPPTGSSQAPPQPASPPPRRRRQGSPHRRGPSPPGSAVPPRQDPLPQPPPRSAVHPKHDSPPPPPSSVVPPKHDSPQPPPSSVVPPKQDSPSPPRQFVPPQNPVVAAPAPPRGRAINYTVGCTTLLVFGDSTVDPGNNNRLRTTAKANFLPYGINFYGRRPTGRFSNGRLATDMLADELGIEKSIPGFLDPTLKLGQLRKGVSFASAGSGYDDTTANTLHAMSFRKQLWQLWRYKLLIRALLGPRRAERLVNKATLVISAGANDMLLNYIASNQSGAISMTQYENYLIARLANYTQVMRLLGGRRFMFVGLPPIGCLPIARTLLGTGPDGCDGYLNQLAASFNSKLIQLSNFMNYQPQTRTTYIDTYTVMRAATENPQSLGLSEVSRGCCGSGMIEVGQTCRGRNTCRDPNKYLYWDAVHPTERTNQLITNVMLDAIGKIYS